MQMHGNETSAVPTHAHKDIQEVKNYPVILLKICLLCGCFKVDQMKNESISFFAFNLPRNVLEEEHNVYVAVFSRHRHANSAGK